MTNCPEIPNIRHLRMTQVIGRLGGLSSAARYLNTSQPAVTQAIANLELLIGTPIFDRCTTGTYATEAGAIFLRRVDRFFEILETGIHDVIGGTEAQKGRPLPQIERIVTGTQLRSLLVTADPATVAAAAAQMDVSPASLYRSARTLERSLGQSLFDRSANGPVFNQQGETLARQVRRAVREIEFGLAEVTIALGCSNVEIVVGALPMSGAFELANAITAFNKEHSTVRIKIVTGSYHALLDDLLNCRVDMIFGLLQKPDWVDEIEEEPLFNDSYCVVTRPGHPLGRLRSVTAAALLDYDWIVPAEGTPRRGHIDSLFCGLNKQPRRNIESNSVTYARALLLGSDMITLMSRSEAQLDASLGAVQCLPCPNLDTITRKGLTTRSDWLPTEVHDKFLDCLRATTASAEHYGPVAPKVVALAS
ncbi:LysR family transcriptional regulator [Puniceibacterium sp. IMCC21224]|uniref:LysR family transcriptional regulator n=1 Tax=Puniceibacterium sp. IMCC21224 TaxID=1618204 RepID=UPI00064D98BC|nr:LysR family transcriptional regulator [Puniceibacterium sp. IMCC21224]KMK65171.1 transcriptional regulator [Puniceibacterium sp. IMCC21224]